MSKIRALNEAESDDSENEDEPKQSREAQEAQATNMYNAALQLVADGKYEESLQMFLNTIDLPYLNDNESRKLSPEQSQRRLSCLKGLATLFRSEQWGTKDTEAAVNVYLKIVELEPTLVNNWVYLGDCALGSGDLVLALDAFKQALSIRSGHFLCLDKVVTISYALNDMYSCLHFCALGFHKDKRFAKAVVFRDYLFQKHPWLKGIVDSNPRLYDILLSAETHNVSYDDTLRESALKEARSLIQASRNVQIEKQKKVKAECEEVLECPLKLSKPTFTELCKLLLAMLEVVKESGTLLRPVSFKDILSECGTTVIVDGSNDASQNSDVGGIKPCIMRSRSSSDDKDSCVAKETDPPCVCDSDTHSQSCAAADWEDKNEGNKLNETEEDRKLQKKKAKRDLKWWQMEGKRRSPRVRGNLVSVLPNKPKVENTFTETLKNIIPPCLLRDSSRDIEGHKTSSTSITQELGTFFGTSEEYEAIGTFVNSEESYTIPTIVYKVVTSLSRNCQGVWPKELVPLFLRLEKFFSSSFPEPRLEDDDFCFEVHELSEKKMNQLFAHLTRFEALSGSRISFSNRDEYKELQVSYINDKLFMLRRAWLEINLRLRENEKSVLPRDLEWLKSCLTKISPTFVCHTASPVNNVISVRTIQEKADFLRRVEYASEIDTLYRAKNFKKLVEVFDECRMGSQDDTFEMQHRLYLAEAYFVLSDIRCVVQYVKIADFNMKHRNEEIMLDCLNALRRSWCNWKNELPMEHIVRIVSILVRLLMEGEKGKLQMSQLLLQPWLFLHEILSYLEDREPEFYIEEDSVPNSVLLLQLAHEFLSQSNNCCMEDGKLLTYTVDELTRIRNKEDYWVHEESKTCLEQAIFCLYGHPSKNRTKLKSIKDHGSPGIELNWQMSLKLFEYYKLDPLPEFDSNNKGISAEVKSLFEQIITNAPDDVKSTLESSYKAMHSYIEGGNMMKPSPPDHALSEISDMFYLIGDQYFRDGKEFVQAKVYYTKDLSINPGRLDSWAAIALIKATEISYQVNSCVPMPVDEIISKSSGVARCFDEALLLDTKNVKLRIEFGTFLYSIHSLFSRELKYPHEHLRMDKFQEIENRKEEFLSEALKWFDPVPNTETIVADNEEDEAEDIWINHYMLGKVMEKKFPLQPRLYLDHYEMAGKLLNEKGATYPSRINYSNPPDLSVEALEIHYRIHASILTYIEKLGHEGHKAVDEDVLFYLMDVIDRARQGPFSSSKHGKSADAGESGKRKGKGTDEKKDEAIIQHLVNELIRKVEEGQIDTSSESQDGCSGSSDDSSSFGVGNNTFSDNKQPSPPVMKSFSLSAFKEKMQSELEEAEAAEEAKAKKKGEREDRKASWVHDGCKSFENAKKFLHLPYGIPIAFCLAAMVECIARFPQSFKAYYRLAYTHKAFIRDLISARRYYLGPGSKRVPGLFGDRKPNNFFNNIWRNPVEDIDRAGSFPFHMAKTVQLLTDICYELSDFQILAELALHLQKTPDSQNIYLYPQDREQFAKEALNQCVKSAGKIVESCRADKIVDEGLRIYDSYIKFQKMNPKQNMLASVLLKMYKKYITVVCPALVNNVAMDVQSAVKFFQHRSWAPRTAGDCPPDTTAITLLHGGFSSESQKRVSDDTEGDSQRKAEISTLPSSSSGERLQMPPLHRAPQPGSSNRLMISNYSSTSSASNVMPIDKRFPSLAKNAQGVRKHNPGPQTPRPQKSVSFSKTNVASAELSNNVPSSMNFPMCSKDLVKISNAILTAQQNENQQSYPSGLLGKRPISTPPLKKTKRTKFAVSPLAMQKPLDGHSVIKFNTSSNPAAKTQQMKTTPPHLYQTVPAGKLTITPVNRGSSSKSYATVSRSYMSSSPFRPQAPLPLRNMSPPSILGLPVGGMSPSPPKPTSIFPPAAHSHGLKISNSNTSSEIDVVDLSVSPEKTPDHNVTSRPAKPFEAAQPLRAILPPPRIIDLKSLAPRRPGAPTLFERGNAISLPPKKKFLRPTGTSPSISTSTPSPRSTQNVPPAKTHEQSSTDKDVDIIVLD